MAEKVHQERNPQENEASAESIQQLARERKETIREAMEKHDLESKAQSEEEALTRAKELAKRSNKEDALPLSPAEKRHPKPTKRQRAAAYNTKMQEIRSEMTPSERVFSKIIHNPVIEATSDFIGSTIARPNAMLSGSITAFALVTIFYFLAKHYGYQLSGFETIGAFVLGWFIGIIYDYVVTLVRGKSR